MLNVGAEKGGHQETKAPGAEGYKVLGSMASIQKNPNEDTCREGWNVSGVEEGRWKVTTSLSFDKFVIDICEHTKEVNEKLKPG